MACDCEFVLCQRALAIGHFLGHVQQEFAVFLVGLGQQTAKFAQVPRIFAGAAPTVFVRRFSLEQIRQLRRLLTVIKELIKWDLESTRQLFQRFDGGNGMTILDAGDIAPEQASALFNVALGEFLCLAHFAEAVAYNHTGIVSLRRMEGKQGST